MEEKIIEELRESAAVKTALANEVTVKQISKVVNLILTTITHNNVIYLFGNGGSAADAQHIAAEMVGRFKLDRPALPAVALTTNTSILTSISNDYASSSMFARQVEALVRENDLVIGISTSGNSANVIEGIKAAKTRGAITIGLTGENGGKLGKMVDICLRAPSNNTPRVQEVHITLGHIICSMIEQELFGKKDEKSCFSR